MDFTINKYKELLIALKQKKYSFDTFGASLNKKTSKQIILRHDVDKAPQNSLEFAKIQNDLGIKGSYYFRAVPESWDKKIILEIADLGHEIGYHYECLTTTNGNIEKGIIDFRTNLEKLRSLAPVSTICMHGSPKSKWDSKDLWEKFDYRNFDIIGEPYFDVDFNDFFYLTDTGRRWDGWKVSVRDKVPQQENWVKEGLVFRSTNHIINYANSNHLPHKIMFTFHPQRWHDNMISWSKEILMQRAKNIVKKYFFVSKQ